MKLGWITEVYDPAPGNLSQEARHIIEAADDSMRHMFCGRVGTGHLLIAAIREDEGRRILRGCGIQPDQLDADIHKAITSDSDIATAHIRFTPAAKRALARAEALAKKDGLENWEVRHLLYGLMPNPSSFCERQLFGANPDDPIERVIDSKTAEKATGREAIGSWRCTSPH